MNRFVLMVLLIFIATSVIACKSETEETNNELAYTIYLANSEMNGLIAIKVDLDAATTEGKIGLIIDYLQKGKETGKATIPAIVHLSSIKIVDTNAVLNFDETYTQMSTVEEILCRSSIVKSITELTGIDSVEFYIGSVPYQNVNGIVEGAMAPEDVVLDFTQDAENGQTKKVLLYFSDKSGEYLVPVEYELALNSEEQTEITILDLLIQGPSSEELVGTIPSETKIKNVYTNEGVCYVDLSEDFVTKHMGGSTAEMMTIYSIVNTLTEMDKINKVQFLIEGSKRAEFKGHLAFDGLFQRNLDLIKK